MNINNNNIINISNNNNNIITSSSSHTKLENDTHTNVTHTNGTHTNGTQNADSKDEFDDLTQSELLLSIEQREGELEALGLEKVALGQKLECFTQSFTESVKHSLIEMNFIHKKKKIKRNHAPAIVPGSAECVQKSLPFTSVARGASIVTYPNWSTSMNRNVSPNSREAALPSDQINSAGAGGVYDVWSQRNNDNSNLLRSQRQIPTGTPEHTGSGWRGGGVFLSGFKKMCGGGGGGGQKNFGRRTSPGMRFTHTHTHTQ
eukprot:GHVR01151203.1.p1 GENE.GHVR01151203.1~~GHVR01151203.1.p1  ORF type:complete len:277 (+),score=125.01 GHVR01151203.1:53-832(+)